MSNYGYNPSVPGVTYSYNVNMKAETVADAVSENAVSAGAITIDMLTAGSKSMTAERAMKVEAFYSCVRDKSETIGQLPVRLYRRKPDGSREQVMSGRTWKLFTQKPCDYITMQGFKEMMVASLETRGAFYAYKEKNDRGNIMSIIPFRNQSGIVPSMDIHGNIYYMYVTNDGKIRDPYNVEDLVIVKSFTLDGFTPVSPIQYMATILGIAESQEDSYRELQENGITAQMALSTENTFNDPAAIKRLKDDWQEYRGPGGRKSIPMLEQGLKPVSLKLTPQESELLSHREFSVNRISSMTGVPLYRVGLGEASAKSTLSDLDEFYMRNKLNPQLIKFENAMNALLPDDMYIDVDRKAFYAGSPWRLVEHVEREVKGGLATINEGREDLGREPVDGGDVFVVDNNNCTYGRWDELPSIREQINNGRAAGGDKPQEKPNEE